MLDDILKFQDRDFHSEYPVAPFTICSFILKSISSSLSPRGFVWFGLLVYVLDVVSQR